MSQPTIVKHIVLTISVMLRSLVLLEKSFKPMAGIFNQDKLIPLRYCPIQIGLEVVNSGADAVFVDMVTAGENILQIGIFLMYSVNAIF